MACADCRRARELRLGLRPPRCGASTASGPSLPGATALFNTSCLAQRAAEQAFVRDVLLVRPPRHKPPTRARLAPTRLFCVRGAPAASTPATSRKSHRFAGPPNREEGCDTSRHF